MRACYVRHCAVRRRTCELGPKGLHAYVQAMARGDDGDACVNLAVGKTVTLKAVVAVACLLCCCLGRNVVPDGGSTGSDM